MTALGSHTAGPSVPKAWPQGFGSQCISPLLSSALRAHLAAEQTSSLALFFFFIPCLPYSCICLSALSQKNLPKGPNTWTQKGHKRELEAEISDLFRLWPETENLLQQPWVFYMVPTTSQLISGLSLLSLALICFSTVNISADSSPYSCLPSWTCILAARQKQKLFLHFPQSSINYTHKH